MNRRIINVDPPKNIKDNNCLFSQHVYEVASLKVLRIQDVQVTHNGICFKNSKIIKESVQAYPDKIRIFELEGQLQFKNKLMISFPNDDEYLIIHHPWLNYYHWLTESIPRIWLVKDRLEALVLLLPEYYKTISFVQDSLKPFKFKQVIYIPSGHNIKIDNAIIPQIKPVCSNYDPDIVNDIRQFYINYAKSIEIANPNLGERIYIMRGNSIRRKIVNEEAVVQVLDKYFFNSITAESFSFFEQVLFSENAKYLVSNGSGLTNMHFMKRGTSVLDIQKKITNENDFHDLVLWYMASAFNLNYYFFICPPVNKYQDMYMADLKIDTIKFEKKIAEMLDQ